jgi:hypothetical protein
LLLDADDVYATVVCAAVANDSKLPPRFATGEKMEKRAVTQKEGQKAYACVVSGHYVNAGLVIDIAYTNII